MNTYIVALDALIEYLKDDTVPSGGKLSTSYFKDWLGVKAKLKAANQDKEDK